MNKLQGIISDISSSGNIHLISVDVGGDTFLSLIITIDDYIKTGKTIYLLFKESEVPISKNMVDKISISNSFSAVITNIEKGIILAKIYLEYKGETIISLITTKSLENLDLKKGDNVFFLIKASTIILMEAKSS